MSIHNATREKYAGVPRDLLYNAELSFEARLFYIYLTDRAEEYISIAEFAVTSPKGIEAVRAAVKELNEYGLLDDCYTVEFELEYEEWQNSQK